MNEKCYDCKFKGNNNLGDIIIGDFWKVPDNLFGNQTKNGVSAIIIKNKKGEELLNSIKNIDIKKVNLDLVINGNPNLENSIVKPIERESFFSEMDQIEINKNFEKNNKKLNSYKKKILKVLFNLKIIKYLKK